MSRTTVRLRHVLPPLAVALLAACARSADRASPAAGGQGTQAAADSAIRQMEAHIHQMEGTSADSTKVMLPEHQQLVATMLTQMTDEMRARNVPADARETALVDSVRQDVARLPELNTSQLAAVMPAHRQRLLRLIARYRTMMGSGGQTRG